MVLLKTESLDFHIFLTLVKYSLQTLSLLTVPAYDIFSSCLITFSLVHLLYFNIVHFKMLSIMFDLSLFNDKMCTFILTKIHADILVKSGNKVELFFNPVSSRIVQLLIVNKKLCVMLVLRSFPSA